MFRYQEGLKLPDGTLIGNRDKMMVLNEWARHYGKLHKEFIFAALGHPTYAISESICESSVQFWKEKEQELESSVGFSLRSRSESVQNPTAQALMAKGLNRFYGLITEPATVQASSLSEQECLTYQNALSNVSRTSGSLIQPENILFTLGGSVGLYSIFKVLRKQNPDGCIITPFPHYTLYAGIRGENHLVPINLMEKRRVPGD